mgnify:CR=1 FL=1
MKNTDDRRREKRAEKRKKQGLDLARDPLLPLVLHFALPAILSYFISELYNMVDTFYVGNAVGPDAIGALGAVFPVQRLVIALSLLFAFATANRMAFYQGLDNQEEAEKTVAAGLILNLIFMIPYTLIVYFFRREIMPFLGAKDALFIPAVDYVSIIIWGSTFLTLSTTMARILLTLGHATLSVILSASGAVINIIADHILVKNHGMGVHGAAYATLASQILSFVFALIAYLLITRKIAFRFRPTFSFRRFKDLFLLGLPSFIVESEDAVVMAVLNLLLFRTAGETGVSVLAMDTKVYMFLFVLILGFAYGMQTIVAFNHGAGNSERVNKTVKLSLGLSLISSLVSSALFFIFAEPLLELFVKDQTLISLCKVTFRIMITGLPLLSFYYTGVMYYQAMGEAKKSLLLTLLRQIAILLPLAMVFVLLFRVRLRTLFFVYPLTDLIASGIVTALLLKEGKKRRSRS